MQPVVELRLETKSSKYGYLDVFIFLFWFVSRLEIQTSLHFRVVR